jgi:hypothetical protein
VSVPPELMQMLSQAGGGMLGEIPTPDMGGSGGEPPVPESVPSTAGGAPMSTPQPANGDKQSAMVNVSLAMDLLEQTLPNLGSESEEGRAVLSVLSALSKKFGQQRAKAQGLQPAELQQLMASLPGAGGMSPEAKAMGQQPMPM